MLKYYTPSYACLCIALFLLGAGYSHIYIIFFLSAALATLIFAFWYVHVKEDASYPAELLFENPAFAVSKAGEVLRANKAGEKVLEQYGNRIREILVAYGASAGGAYRLLNGGAPEVMPDGYGFFARPLQKGETLIAMFTPDGKKIDNPSSLLTQSDKNILKTAPFNVGFFEMISGGGFDKAARSEAAAEITAVNDTMRKWLEKDVELKKFLAGFGQKVRAARIGEEGEEEFFIENLLITDREDVNAPIFRVLLHQDDREGCGSGFVFPVSPHEVGADSFSAGLYAKVFDICPVALAIGSAEGEILECNRAFLKLALAEASVGDNIRDYIADIDAEIWRTLIKDKKPAELRFKGETERYVRASVHKITGGIEGGADQYVYFFIDLTDSKVLEQKFNQSQKMQAVGQLAGGVAHDFNNLLTAILGHVELALTRFEPGHPCFSDLTQIRQNANRAGGLVRQLLAFSRRQTFVVKQVNLTDILPDLSHLLNRTMGDKIKLNTEYGRDLYDIKIDIGQFERVIVNLAVNARDAMPDGGALSIKTVNISVNKNETRGYDIMPAGDYVAVFVEDTGGGMPESVREKIFEPFFTTKEPGHGTGLGLSTVYGIVKQSGGFIFVFSEIGKGTRFEMYFPKADSLEEEEETLIDPEAEKDMSVLETPVVTDAASEEASAPKTILVAEDEDSVRAFVVRALKMRGYRVIEADCGEEALVIYRESHENIDLILSDVIMPGADGPQWVKAALATDPNVRVIFMSGYAEDAYRNDPEQNETAGFLPKPFSLKQLTDTVKNALKL